MPTQASDGYLFYLSLNVCKFQFNWKRVWTNDGAPLKYRGRLNALVVFLCGA